jgi:hypothetical protein
VTLLAHGCPLHAIVAALGFDERTVAAWWARSGRHGQSVYRHVEVEYSDGRVVQEQLHFVVVHSSQLAQQQAQTYAIAQAKEATALADHRQHVHARWSACEADATAAIAEYEHRGPGRRGRRPQAWRYHAVCYRVVADTRRTAARPD